MTSAQVEVLEELKGLTLTQVHGRKPTAIDVDRWEDEAAAIATLIKTRAIYRGQIHGHQAIIIPADEYAVVIGDEDFVYVPPEDPGSYPDLQRDKEEQDIKRLEAEHKVAVSD